MGVIPRSTAGGICDIFAQPCCRSSSGAFRKSEIGRFVCPAGYTATFRGSLVVPLVGRSSSAKSPARRWLPRR